MMAKRGMRVIIGRQRHGRTLSLRKKKTRPVGSLNLTGLEQTAGVRLVKRTCYWAGAAAAPGAALTSCLVCSMTVFTIFFWSSVKLGSFTSLSSTMSASSYLVYRMLKPTWVTRVLSSWLELVNASVSFGRSTVTPFTLGDGRAWSAFLQPANTTKNAVSNPSTRLIFFIIWGCLF